MSLTAPRFGAECHAGPDKISCGLEFNGENAFVDLGKTGLLEGVNELTISHWVYLTSDNGWKRTVATGDKVVRIYIKGRKFHFEISDKDGNRKDAAISDSRFPLNEWIHVTAVYDGSDSILYVNGQESGRTEIGSVTTPTPGARMGFSAGRNRKGKLSAENGFEGLMGGVRMYDRALSAKEVSQLVNGKQVSEGLVGWWPMEACDGDRVRDRSGNGNHGKLIGADRTKALIPSRLQDQPSDQVVPSLVRMIKQHPNDVVRTQAAKALPLLDVSTEQIRSILQKAGQEAEDVKQVRPAVVLVLAYYRTSSDRPEAVEALVPPLLDILNNSNTSNKTQKNARNTLKQLEDWRGKTSMVNELVTLLADAKNRDAIRRAIMDGAGALDDLSEPLDRGAEHPLPETPDQIAQYRSHVLERFHEEISRYPRMVKRISSLKQLSEYAGKSGVHIRMKPGIYEVTPDNYKHFLGPSNESTLFHFSGSNSAFDLRGVEVKTDTSLPVEDVRVSGSRLIIKGLTITNVGNEIGEKVGGRTLVVKGAANLLKGITVYARGNSYPYGYMNGRDAYRKLYRPGHISDISKNVAVMGGGSSVVFDNVHIYQRGSGHALSWSGDVRSTFINCHIEGQVRMSDDILEGTNGGFYTDEDELAEGAMKEIKNILSPGEIVPLSEDAYRSYGRRGVTLKVLGGTVKNLRNAFKRGSYNTFFISNVRVSGIRLPFAFTGGREVNRIVNCEVDLLNGGLMAIGSDEIDVTLVPPDPNTLPQYAMKKKIRAAYPDRNSGLVFGKDNTVYLRAGKNLPIDLVRERPPLKVNGDGTFVRNETGLPIKLTKKSKNCEIITNGEVTDRGEGNEVKHID